MQESPFAGAGFPGARGIVPCAQCRVRGRKPGEPEADPDAPATVANRRKSAEHAFLATFFTPLSEHTMPTPHPSVSSRRTAIERKFLQLALLGGLLFAAPAFAADTGTAAGNKADQNTYDQDSIMKDAAEFFGQTTEGLAKVIEKVFKEHGRPNGYIKGQEAGGAMTVGLRYGDGMLRMKGGADRRVYWSGPSVGFDVGGNASKVFVLAYHLPSAEKLFQRFPSVDGSLYYVGGVGVNYQRRDNIVLAPIRLGVGLRAGASVGYMHYTKKKTLNPF
jgi:hypothetical protein